MKLKKLTIYCLALFCSSSSVYAQSGEEVQKKRSGNPIFPGWYADPEGVVLDEMCIRDSNIWVRRTVNIDRDLTGIPVYLEFSNDDDAVFYINGVKIHSTGTTCNKNKVVKLSDEALAALKQGDNIIAAECINPVGNGLLDFGLQIPKHQETVFGNTCLLYTSKRK